MYTPIFTGLQLVLYIYTTRQCVSKGAYKRYGSVIFLSSDGWRITKLHHSSLSIRPASFVLASAKVCEFSRHEQYAFSHFLYNPAFHKHTWILKRKEFLSALMVGQNGIC
jgi:hypothetical protein